MFFRTLRWILPKFYLVYHSYKRLKVHNLNVAVDYKYIKKLDGKKNILIEQIRKELEEIIKELEEDYHE